jgi:CubicO group peptidase (beta-lactamase class C family)
MADLESGVPITPETIFYAASVSKQFTAACLATLVVEGVIDADEHVRSLLPELAPLYRQVTLRHLVHHTSGIPDFYLAMEKEGHHPLLDTHTPDLVMTLLNRQSALTSRPGTRFAYSNSNYFLIARVVERLTGEPLDRFARRRLFEPLGLADTAFQHDPTKPVPGRATAYGRTPDGFDRNQARTPLVGAGGLNTTVLDLIRWDHALAHGTLGSDLTRLIHTPGRTGMRTIDYAWGLWIRERKGLSTVEHGGSLAGFRSALLRLPRHRLTVAILANSAEATATHTAHETARTVLTLPRRVRRTLLTENQQPPFLGEARRPEPAIPQ